MNGEELTGGNEYDAPPLSEEETGLNEELENESGDVEVAEPDLEAGEDAAAIEAAEESDEFGVDEVVLDAHEAITQKLASLVVETESLVQIEDDLGGAGNIVGVGIGFDPEADDSSADPGVPALNVYVEAPCSVDDVQSFLVDEMGVSAASSDSFPINVIVSGTIDADSFRFRIRPAPGGVSTGHFRITAGTLGCLARGRRAPRNRRILILSNNHVLADSNRGRFGDAILQPGRADGGRNPRDRIAILERYVPIRFDGRCNYVDCATAWAWPSRVRRELIYRARGRLRLFRINSRVASCRRNMIVGKTGRTTELTRGRVTDCSANIRVNYGGGRRALFCRQMIVRGFSGSFSAGGDSGSVIWSWDRRRNPVGLLFAGNSSNNITIANHMSHVVQALDIGLYT